ncbi:MAG: hypothetical protein V3U57_08625 [Robiginitomaculum sp.]
MALTNPFNKGNELPALRGLDAAKAVLDWRKLEQLMSKIYANKTGRAQAIRC